MASWQRGLGAFLQGFTGGIERAEERKRQKELLDIQKRRLDLEDRESLYRESELKRKMTQAEKMESLIGEYSGAQGQQEAFRSYEPDPEETSLMNPNQAPARTPKSVLEEIALRTGKVDRLLDRGGSPSSVNTFESGIARGLAGQNADPEAYFQAAERFKKLTPERQGVGVESQTWSRIMKENPGADLETLRGIYNAEVQRTAEARGFGGRMGGIEATTTPAAREGARNVEMGRTEGKPVGESTAGKMAQLNSLLNTTIPTIRENFDKNYLGPVKGTELAFETRRRIGSSIGSKVSGNETNFRLALKDAGDILLRARSGAQINEQEYKRLSSILPKPTDEEGVFKAGLSRFESELKSILAEQTKAAKTPRGQLGGPGGSLPPPPPGWR